MINPNSAALRQWGTAFLKYLQNLKSLDLVVCDIAKVKGLNYPTGLLDTCKNRGTPNIWRYFNFHVFNQRFESRELWKKRFEFWHLCEFAAYNSLMFLFLIRGRGAILPIRPCKEGLSSHWDRNRVLTWKPYIKVKTQEAWINKCWLISLENDSNFTVPIFPMNVLSVSLKV